MCSFADNTGKPSRAGKCRPVGAVRLCRTASLAVAGQISQFLVASLLCSTIGINVAHPDASDVVVIPSTAPAAMVTKLVEYIIAHGAKIGFIPFRHAQTIADFGAEFCC